VTLAPPHQVDAFYQDACGQLPDNGQRLHKIAFPRTPDVAVHDRIAYPDRSIKVFNVRNRPNSETMKVGSQIEDRPLAFAKLAG
jgi:hypothetical protein